MPAPTPAAPLQPTDQSAMRPDQHLVNEAAAGLLEIISSEMSTDACIDEVAELIDIHAIPVASIHALPCTEQVADRIYNAALTGIALALKVEWPAAQRPQLFTISAAYEAARPRAWSSIMNAAIGLTAQAAG